MSEDRLDYNSLSDEQLVLSVRSGDEECLPILFKRYVPTIKSLAKSICPNIETEDMMQEGLIALYSAIKVYNCELSKFSTFAVVCIKRSMLSLCRKMYAHKQIPNDKIYSLEDNDDNGMGYISSPETLLIEKEDCEILSDKIKTVLSPLEYKVLTAYLYHFTYEKVAEELGLSVKSVNNAISRARAKIKQ